MPTEAICVYTFKSRERIIANGGTSSWVLNRAKARGCEWVICARNGNHAAAEGSETHGSAFLVARVRDIVPSPELGYEDRWLIRFDEYAEVELPDVWKGWRNPVKYLSLEELDIDPTRLALKPMPDDAGRSSAAVTEREVAEDAPFTLTIAKAKEGLANAFGVSTEAVHITIHG